MAQARLIFTLGRSGSGKSYIQNLITEKYGNFSYIPIYTDRPYRGMDDDKSHTLCITKEQMDDIIASGDALALKTYPVILPGDGSKGEWRYCFLKSDFREIAKYCTNTESATTKLYIVVSPTREVFEDITEFLTDETDVMEILVNPKKIEPRLLVDVIYVYRDKFECIASSIRRGYQQCVAKYINDDERMIALHSDPRDEQLRLDLMTMYQESCRRSIYSDDPAWGAFDNAIRMHLMVNTVEDAFSMAPISTDRMHEPLRSSAEVLCPDSKQFIGFDVLVNNDNHRDHIQEATIKTYLQLIHVPEASIEATRQFIPNAINYAFNHRVYNKRQEKIENS